MQKLWNKSGCRKWPQGIKLKADAQVSNISQQLKVYQMTRHDAAAVHVFTGVIALSSTIITFVQLTKTVTLIP